MCLNRVIFREYDIRGNADRDLNNEAVICIAKGIATFFLQRGKYELIIGQDNRLSSERISSQLIRTLKSFGIDIISLGIVTTPMFYFASTKLKIDAGVMITASHNPKDENGFKILFGVATIFGVAIQELAKNCGTSELKYSDKDGKCKSVDISIDYKKDLRNRIKLGKRKLKVLIDCGNGTTSFHTPNILKSFSNLEIVELNCKSDPNFPKHVPDPVIKKNLIEAIDLVKREKCDLGIAFDGDGDRIGIIDNLGNIIWGDKLLVLLGEEVLKKNPYRFIIGEVKCSQIFIDKIKEFGGIPELYRTGFAYVKNRMIETNAPLSGEMSGHIFFSDEHPGYNDALYTALRVIRILVEKEKKLSELLPKEPKYYSTPEIRVSISEEKKFTVVEASKKHFMGYSTLEIDGIRATNNDGWGLIRASNTSPKLIVRAEAKTEEGLMNIKNKIVEVLASVCREMSLTPLIVNWDQEE